jgi:hypothetical protein
VFAIEDCISADMLTQSLSGRPVAAIYIPVKLESIKRLVRASTFQFIFMQVPETEQRYCETWLGRTHVFTVISSVHEDVLLLKAILNIHLSATPRTLPHTVLAFNLSHTYQQLHSNPPSDPTEPDIRKYHHAQRTHKSPSLTHNTRLPHHRQHTHRSLHTLHR